MNGWLNGWRTSLRIARREARRAKGRSLMVVAMIGLPVLALTFVAVTYDMVNLTPAERVDRQLGRADARVEWVSTGPIEQSPDGSMWNIIDGQAPVATEADLLSRLPAGSRLTSYQSGYLSLRTTTGRADLAGWALDLTDPLLTGIVSLHSGRAPDGGAEVALSPPAADHLGLGLGDTLLLSDGSRGFTVVGLVEFPDSLTEHVVFPRDGLPATIRRYGSPNTTWLVRTPAPIDWATVKTLNAKGLAVTSRAVLLDPPPAEEDPFFTDPGIGSVQEVSVGVLIAGLALLEVVLLAGPAFAVGARRRQRQLALVAANGGTGAQIRRIVLADGVVLGLVGATIGIALGIGVAFAGRPLVEEYLTYSRAGGYRIFPAALLAIAALAVVTGLLAALVPALIAARQSIVSALSGQRGVTRSKRRWLIVGLVLVATGSAIAAYGAHRVQTNTVLTGLIIGELGLVLCTPALVGLIARLGGHLPLAPRIALRDTARNRAAAAPAISAVMAAVAGSVILGVYLSSDSAREHRMFHQSLPLGHVSVVMPPMSDGPALGPAQIDRIASALRANLPVDRVTQIYTPGCTSVSPDTSPSTSPSTNPETGPATCYLGVAAEPPAARRCPADPTQPLTPAQQKAAAHDARCQGLFSELSSGELGFIPFVDDGANLALLTGASGEDLTRAVATLRAGGVVVTDERYLDHGMITMVFTRADGRSGPEQRFTVPGHVLTSGEDIDRMVIAPQLVGRAGGQPQLLAVVAATTRTSTNAELDATREDLQAINEYLYPTIERGMPTRRDPLLLVLAGAAGLITLGAAGIATGLAAAEGRRDLSTLAAVGASPRVRRILSLSQSGVIAGLGSLLGAAAGLGASIVVLTAMNRAYADIWPTPPPWPVTIPWPGLSVSLVVVPAVAMLGAGLFTRSRLPIERRPG